MKTPNCGDIQMWYFFKDVTGSPMDYNISAFTDDESFPDNPEANFKLCTLFLFNDTNYQEFVSKYTNEFPVQIMSFF